MPHLQQRVLRQAYYHVDVVRGEDSISLYNISIVWSLYLYFVIKHIVKLFLVQIRFWDILTPLFKKHPWTLLLEGVVTRLQLSGVLIDHNKRNYVAPYPI